MIGVRLPLTSSSPGSTRPSRRSAEGGGDAAEAIMTTDTRAKEPSSARRLHRRRDGEGLGMIHPDLATMLAVITTDYPLDPGRGARVPAPRGRRSFNAISVDGEPSTNDCVILLANGASGDRAHAETDAAFAAALAEVCADLARPVVADGEGITVLAEINVTAPSTTRRRRRSPAGSRPRRSSRPRSSATTRTGAAC